jgi:2-polyprenyl-6-methoxyphenol hydroxylase-like FAD-dependent oxidoreductase
MSRVIHASVDARLAIGVVGAGTAGAAAATLLARAGHTVDILECVATPRAIGAGITLQPTGQAALARLGVLDLVEARGARIDRLVCVRRGGKYLVDLPYADIDPRLYGLGIHRGVLFEVLFAAAAAAGARITCGVRVASRSPDRRFLVDTQGNRHGPYDLVICADGSICELHAEASRCTSSPYPYGALWVVVADPGFAAQKTLHQTVDGPQHLLGFLPTGMGPNSETPVVSLFWSLRVDQHAAWRAAGLSAWRDQVLRLDARAEPILDTLDDLEPVLFSKYRDVRMYPWHGDRIVFVGDAAHAMSPQLGQGANLALVDAITLADCIEREPDVARALAAYTAARRRHLAFYQFATRALTPLFQSDSRVFGWLRDRLFPTSRWLGVLRRRMVRSMVGIERGFIRRPIPIADVVRPALLSDQVTPCG